MIHPVGESKEQEWQKKRREVANYEGTSQAEQNETNIEAMRRDISELKSAVAVLQQIFQSIAKELDNRVTHPEFAPTKWFVYGASFSGILGGVFYILYRALLK